MPMDTLINALGGFSNAITPKIPRPFLYGAITGGYHMIGVMLAALIIAAMR